MMSLGFVFVLGADRELGRLVELVSCPSRVTGRRPHRDPDRLCPDEPRAAHDRPHAAEPAWPQGAAACRRRADERARRCPGGQPATPAPPERTARSRRTIRRRWRQTLERAPRGGAEHCTTARADVGLGGPARRTTAHANGTADGASRVAGETCRRRCGHGARCLCGLSSGERPGKRCDRRRSDHVE